MKITEHLLKLSGADYGTNSNSYGILYDGGIALIDCGYSELQWQMMEETLNTWGHSLSEVTHVFLTHGHFDHCYNAHRVNALGAKLLTSKADITLIEEGNPESEELFGISWIPAKVTETICEGQVFSFPGASVTVMETPGHSMGSLSFLIEVDGIRAVTTGDMFWTIPVPPKDEVTVELGYMGSRDFSMPHFVESLKRISEMDFDLFLPGHYYIYRGPMLKGLTKLAYEKAKALEECK